MKPLPATPELLAIAPRVIWFEEPERALADPVRFMAYAMTYATHDDMSVLRSYVTDEELREALSQTPPGIFDGRSWAYWHLKVSEYPAPPLPTRRIVDAAT